MASVFGSSDDEPISGINVTPLVDVVLVLLIIFLITAPVIYQTAIKVRLAPAATGETASKDQKLNILISKTGELAWNGQAISHAGLEEKLRSLGENIAQETAVISADRDAPHGMVVELMDTLRAAGLTHLALQVEKH